MEAELARDPRLAAALEEMRETRSNLDWRALRDRIESPDPAANSLPAAEPAFLPAILKRLEAWLPRPSRPALVWAGAFAMLLLLIPLAPPLSKGGSGLRAKGHAGPEVVLEIGGSRLATGQKRNVQPGEILGFNYRSVEPLYTQIWYREDGGEPNLFDGRSDSSLYWPASSGWSPAPQRIRLEGDWKVQRVIILVSPDRIAPAEARRIVRGELKPEKRAGLFTYDLTRP